MPVFTATFSAVAATAAQDVFEIATSASSRVRIREIRLSQYSDFGDAQSELLSVSIIRGNATSGSGGTTVTPANLEPWSRAAVTTVEANNTTVASTGSPQTLIVDAWNVAANWWYAPPRDEQPQVDINSRLVVRITAPADSLTINGTIVFEETNSP